MKRSWGWVEIEGIPRGKLSTAGYFSLVMVSLQGASAAGPTCCGRSNIWWLLINAGSIFHSHIKKTNIQSSQFAIMDTESNKHAHTHFKVNKGCLRCWECERMWMFIFSSIHLYEATAVSCSGIMRRRLLAYNLSHWQPIEHAHYTHQTDFLPCCEVCKTTMSAKYTNTPSVLTCEQTLHLKMQVRLHPSMFSRCFPFRI